MDNFEQELARATAGENPALLAAIGLVVDDKGNTLYHHAAGRQSLVLDAPPVDPSSVVSLGSAGKFITHVAALQCVERSLIGLDEAIDAHLPELAKMDVISPGEPFTLRRPSNPITLRHLLTHSSGISYQGHPLVQEWKKSPQGVAAQPSEDANMIVKVSSMPLLYDPGEGWSYGSSIEWTTLLISRLTGKSLSTFTQESIFDPLGLNLSSFQPGSDPKVSGKMLQMVQRQGDSKLVSAPAESVRGLACSVADIRTILVDLISPSPKLLSRASTDLLFQPAFAPSSPAVAALRSETEDYAAPAGIPSALTHPPVNYNVGGLYVEEQLPLSHLPAGTVTWNGMPNVIWAMNREKGIALLFATQLLPVDDEKTVEIAMAFMKGAWAQFT
ncbi:beta-lactamase family protein [Mycena amicta]|nr:beta-lactamase family protein [Mycena amicta]